MESPNKNLNTVFDKLVNAILQDLQVPQRRKDAYVAAIAILKQMDFGLVVKPGTPASRLTSASLPFAIDKKEIA